MFDLTKAEDLVKGGKSIGGFFAAQAQELEKAFSFHKGLATHHEGLRDHSEGLHKAASQAASEAEAMHKSLGSEHEMKAYFSKAHAQFTSDAEHHKAISVHHDGLAKAHAAHADAYKAQMDTFKALSAEWGGSAITKVDANGHSTTVPVPTNLAAAGTIQEKFNVVTDTIMTKALEQISSNPKVLEALEGLALDAVNKLVGEKIGDKLAPSQISVITPNAPAGRAVLRPGQPNINSGASMPKVELQFQHLVKVDE